ncbi:MAG: alpha/beta hydrolase [Spirochaetes bacterium]|nr:alpha/beta hydrolase [Spirochaetota bacterium]
MRHSFLAAAMLIVCAGCSTAPYTVESVREELRREKIGESHFVAVGPHTLHYLEAGTGEPMILIHGWLCWGAYWKKIIPLVADRYRVIAPDLLGHGISDKPLDPAVSYGTDAQAERIIALMDSLGIERAYVVGHSMGGEIAAKVALAAPDRVRGLVLICAAGMEETPKLLPGYVRAGRALRMEGILADILTEGMVRRHIKGLMFFRENEVPEEFIRDVAMCNLKGKEDRKAMARVTREGLFRNFLDGRCEGISAPTLVISAKYDRVVPSAMGERYHSLLPDSRFVLIDRAAHMVPWEQADQVAASINDYFTSR